MPQPARAALWPFSRRAVEPLGEFDDRAFGSAHVAEEERVLEVDDLPDRLVEVLDDKTDVDEVGDAGPIAVR